MENFEQFLQSKHADDYRGTDDNMPDDFERWLVSLETKDIMIYAQSWGELQAIKAKEYVLGQLDPHIAGLSLDFGTLERAAKELYPK